MRFLISISYDGSQFEGFQKQKGKKTVQGILESALTKIDKTDVTIKGAGRTDRGVHAYDQKCHFDLVHNIPSLRLKNAINDLVGRYIVVEDCTQIDDNFHARFNVKEKEYIYKINTGKYDPIKVNYYLQLSNNLNINKMRDASKLFIGKHDFRSFVSGIRDNYNAMIYSIKISRVKDIITISFRGKSFYRYMVRNLVGALIEVGTSKIDRFRIKELLENGTGEVELPTAPSSGLYLYKIKY